ncbi:phage tail assembly chaperone [Pseudomonas fontis]|uniref:Phage tail assembly chaperone n=1 Tax=Pseudomonas fontis TaxID=2942633 RepID=A0ABT5NPN1_9PSED|nr:phage tail assembly chaperone [Pseudomonas fontis]MDD0972426.1 phage tail assembly chaperone [Pseudomonas fontis]MDD0990117.1 phage tail assembly chaperone [Pseudomonas fontis]
MMYAKWVNEDGRFAFSDSENGGVKITKAHHHVLLEGESAGQQIAIDEDGYPVLIDAPSASVEQLSAQSRQWRDFEIERVKWLRERHRDESESPRETTLTGKQFGELLDYLQALRDWPASAGFPERASRPEIPAWIATQTQ